MARRFYPLVDQLTGIPSTGPRLGGPVLQTHGTVLNLYADLACTTPADTVAADGVTVITSVTVGGTTIPVFQGPADGTSVLYARPAGGGDVFLLRAVVDSAFTAIPTAEKGAANGVAQLDAGTKVPAAQLPRGTANGVAALDAGGKVPTAQLPAASVTVGPDLITPFLAAGPLVFAHRGAHNLYPENSLEGFRKVGQDGFAPELDLRTLSTGQAVVIHDATIDRTMDGTGTVSAMTLAQWRARSILPQIQNGQQAMGAMWLDVLAELGGRFLLTPEVKVAGAQAPLIAPVIARGLQRAVIFQSFDLTTAQAIAAAGCASMFLTTNVISGISPAALRASGVEFVGFDATVTGATITAAKAAGLKCAIYTIDTVAGFANAITTLGADGVFSDDPWFAAGRYAEKSSDPFQNRDAWPHLLGYTTATGNLDADTLSSTRLQYAPPIGLRRYNYVGTDGGGTLAVALGWAGQSRGPRMRVRFTSTFLEGASAQTRWVGMFLGTQTLADDVYHDTAYAGQNGYHFFVRRTGILEIYRVAPGVAPANLVTSGTPGTALAAAGLRGQPNRFEIVVDATNVTFTNLTTGLSVTNANTGFRGASRVDLTTNGTDSEWDSIGVEDLA